MRVVLQRVTEASVDVEGTTAGAIGQGLVVLVGVEARDTIDDVAWMAKKIWNIRLWEDADSKPWTDSAAKRKFEILVVSQFTLHARLKGNKPDFHLAEQPAKAETVYNLFVAELNRMKPEGSSDVATGKFGASMAVKLVNDGPVTITVDSQVVQFPRKNKSAGGVAGAAASAREVDVPWVAPSGEESQEEVMPLQADSEGMIGPPVGALPKGTPMTTIMHAVPDQAKAGSVIDVPLPSGMSVKVRVPEDKSGGDVVQLQIPSALMDPEFRQKQEHAKQLQLQGMAIIDFKVPEGHKAGDDCSIRLPSGVSVKITVPKGKTAGDILKVRVPRPSLAPQNQIIPFTVPEGKAAGDECEIKLNSGQILKVKIPEGKVAGDVLRLTVPAAMNRGVQVPPGTPMEKIKWTIPEGKGPGDRVNINLPSGMSLNITIAEGKKAGDVLDLEVPKPFLDPRFREKRAMYMEQQKLAQQKAQQGGGLDAITEGGEEEEEVKGPAPAPRKVTKKKGKKKKKK